MIKPTIHLNGSSPGALYEQLCEALGATRRLLDALAGAHPNARDYYPQGPDAYKQAEAEYRSRVERIVSVRAELEELAEHITDELDRIDDERNRGNQ